MLSLRMAAMRESLQRLGRFDPQRARERLSRAFEPAHTRHILQDGERIGFVVVLPAWTTCWCWTTSTCSPAGPGPGHRQLGDGPGAGRGPPTLGLSVKVTALKLSDANRFYQRHGFELRR
jgi:hypothetical protein